MNTIVSSESAWQPAYDGMANADDTRVPQCTEGIMELIKGITGTQKTLVTREFISVVIILSIIIVCSVYF